jgi:hypothetical protein
VLFRNVGLSSFVAIALIATIARNASAVELHWQAPSECPRSELVAKDIARLAGAQEGHALVAQVVIARDIDDRWRVVIDLSGSAAGHRELTADNCSQLTRAAALIIALAANPEAALDLPTEELERGDDSRRITTANGNQATAIEPTNPTLTQTTPASQASTSARPPNSSTIEAENETRPLQLWPLMAIGYDKLSVPNATGFLRFGLRVLKRRFGGELVADMTRSERTGFADGFGAKFRATGAHLLGCIEPFALPFRAAMCIGPRLDVLTANGYGTTKDYNAWVLRPSGDFAAQFSYNVSSRFFLGVSSEMLVFARRPKFVVENVDALLYQPATLGFRVAIEVGFRP